MITRKQSGFTMVELLTVIAIIAILAAIIFPIMSAAKASARRTQCISNMEQIFQAMQLFKADEHRYPDFIAGPVAWKAPNDAYKLTESKGVTQNGTLVSLYPEYIKAATDLKCPLSRATSTDIQVDPMYDLLNALDWTNRTPPLRSIGEDLGSGNVPFQLYSACTYDVQLPKGATESEVHYSTIWSNDDSETITSAISDQSMREAALATIERQLRWRQPPSDTVITWCSYHRDVANDGTPTSGSRDIVLFMDGNVKSIPSTVIRDSGWKNVWEKVNPNTGK
jgi:prepilin-type N-terminal cleavage/methylation domain-containing protein